MMIVDENDDLELLEGGNEENAAERVMALKRMFRSRAFFRIAKSEEMEAQIVHDSPSVKTLWYGIRFWPDSQASLLYPGFFLVRRLIYAALVVFGPEFAFWQIILLMYLSFATVLVLVTQTVWQSKLITQMHLVNESVFISLCLAQICFFPGVFIGAAQGSTTFRGILIVVLVSGLIIFNLVCILYDALTEWYRPHMRRRRNIVEFRIKNRHNRVLINQRNIFMAKKLR